MLTSVYNGAFTHGVNGIAQGSGFEGCFAREQGGNRRQNDRWINTFVMQNDNTIRSIA
jgi:hypothetical protein